MAKQEYWVLNQAEIHEDVLAPGKTEIWYMKPEVFRNLGMGIEFANKHAPAQMIPHPLALSRTHIMLGRVKGKSLDNLYRALQGDFWSPNGEARSLIKELGLQHTSMSVGDIIVKDGMAYMVDMAGFAEMGRVDARP